MGKVVESKVAERLIYLFAAVFVVNAVVGMIRGQWDYPLAMTALATLIGTIYGAQEFKRHQKRGEDDDSSGGGKS